MDREEIIRMAREAKLSNEIGAFGYPYLPELERFAALVAAHEREACARVCDARFMGDLNREDLEARRCAQAIRERS